jgi:hypothetical protein
MTVWRMVGHPSRFLEGGYPRNPIITIPFQFTVVEMVMMLKKVVVG